MKLIIPSLISIILATASSNTPKDNDASIDLPFYNDAQFSAMWIGEEDAQYDSIHTIIPFTLIDQNGEIFNSDSLMNKIYVANFFFTTCPGVCPRMTSNLMAVQEAFEGDNSVRILSHTVMPWQDSVALLKEYEVARGIDGNMWYLLTGTKKELYTLARGSYFADEGFGKSVTIESDFLHTENLVLIDTHQRLRGVYNGTSQLDVKHLVEDIKTLQKEADL